MEAAFARTEEAFGGIDVVVNAAGIAPRSSIINFSTTLTRRSVPGASPESGPR
jgi:NAD(P)-dependent dehydrogenase (short-subunit alcohol dehydrogenase family)